MPITRHDKLETSLAIKWHHHIMCHLTHVNNTYLSFSSFTKTAMSFTLGSLLIAAYKVATLTITSYVIEISIANLCPC
jgi:hypothetical protein